MLVSKSEGSHKIGFFLLDYFPTFFIPAKQRTDSFSSLHYFLVSSEKSILYLSCNLQNKFVNKGKAMKLQETALTEESYDVQLSVKPIYFPMGDLFKRTYSTTGEENPYQGTIH